MPVEMSVDFGSWGFSSKSTTLPSASIATTPKFLASSIELARNFGVVAIDADKKVVDFEEKPEKPKSTLISTGIYYFPKDKVAFINEYVKMQTKLDAPGHYIGWLSRRDEVYGFTFTEDWYDIGTLESYNKADGDYRKKESGENVKE